MANKTVVEFIEEWQLGAFIIFGSVGGGLLGVLLVGQFDLNPLLGFLVGVIATFLVISRILYSR